MNPIQLITKKKLGKRLTREELEFFIAGLVKGEIPDYQISAFLMAAYLKGLDEDEVYDLTELMLHSGQTIKFDFRHVWDKHSTGGVGDKVSIILAPILASFGIKVPMISGRSLGHTGGTIDKLESIPDFKAEQPFDKLNALLVETGFFIISQSAEIAPADRRLYAIRDVTSTIDSIPLIVASILSKKFAVGIEGLILDIKCGKGAFMTSLDNARELSNYVERIGGRFEKKVKTMITAMDQPIGRMVGNSLEIIESIEFLKGKFEPDIKDLVFKMAEIVLDDVGIKTDITDEITSGRPLELLGSFIRNQGGNDRIIDDYSMLPMADNRYELKSESDGWISGIDAHQVGELMVELGGGRRTIGDTIDHRVGFEFLKKVGDQVNRNDVIAIVYLADQDQKKIIKKEKFIEVAPDPIKPGPLIFETS